uniref:Moesin/ezrin/radixin homolog 1 n=1 Tax=Globodera rostochiensis TaxID=31243 RepID=A0A914HMK2_GLORO
MGRMLEWLTEHGKPLRVKVTTMDADLNELSLERDSVGQHLFDTVCKIIGLREIWYFGLCFTNRKGFTCWLQMDKRIRDQSVPKQPDGSLHFLFLVKFFPESVKGELIQDLTRHLFFLQIRQSILTMDLYCPSEAAILLASYAVQALYGDQGQHQQQQQAEQLDLAKLLPVSVLQQYELTADMWEEKIRSWWANNSGLSKEEAEEEFLCVAEELDMYGTQYYPIRNQKDAELLLGVSALGVGIFETDNKLSPRPFFPWTEIKCISFKHKMFTIYTADKSKIKFRAQDMSINQSLLDLCVGTHNLYLRRRQPDLLEVQQMKLQADEQRRRRMEEQTRLHREREQRAQAEQERDRYRVELNHLSEQLSAMQSVIKSAEETQVLIAERARLSEQEAIEQARRASEAEAEAQRAKLSQLRAEETKMVLERKMREAEMVAQKLALQQQQKQQQQQQQQNNTNGISAVTVGQQQMPQPPPYQEAVESRQQQQPMVVNGGAMPSNRPTTAQSPKNGMASNNLIISTQSQQVQQLYTGSQYELATTMPESRTSIAAELQHIYAELEMSRSEYNERNHSLRERLVNFRAELELLKREGTDTENDRLFAQKMIAGHGFDKFSTLRKSNSAVWLRTLHRS